MSNPKWTPGPWIIEHSANQYEWMIITPERKRLAQWIFKLSDARLISAAPEMAEALEAALHEIQSFLRCATSDDGCPGGIGFQDHHEGMADAEMKLQMALRKARGEE